MSIAKKKKRKMSVALQDMTYFQQHSVVIFTLQNVFLDNNFKSASLQKYHD